jgi:heme-degrading monooxygenase HmoA
MFARVTSFEVDTVRTSFEEARLFFDSEVLPEVRRQPGYAGVLLMRTPDGHGLLITLWETEEAAASGLTSGFYQEQVAKFLTVMRQPPGREHYEVLQVEGIPAQAAV